MYVITNREVLERKTGLDRFGKRVNPKGPNELRLFEVTRSAGDWRVGAVPDELSASARRGIPVPADEPAYGSHLVASKLTRRVRQARKNIVFFVHGFNNDMEAVVKRAAGFESRYGVEVVAFSWPANGGGAGVASYKSDKRDARASAGALERVLAKSAGLLDLFRADRLKELRVQATARHPDNPERREEMYARLLERDCPFTVNLLLHSMGNYLYKKMLGSNVNEGNRLLFDNVILAAADTNNEAHREWVDKIRFRNRLYITINEKDRALAASRAKAGEEQKARLGHCLSDLESERAIYVDFTGASHVGKSHAYFESTPATRNRAVRRFFKEALNGKAAEGALHYHASRGTYCLRRA